MTISLTYRQLTNEILTRNYQWHEEVVLVTHTASKLLKASLNRCVVRVCCKSDRHWLTADGYGVSQLCV